MSQIYPDEKKEKVNTFNNTLIISDLDEFFKNVYDYYYNRGYNNILTGIILDNISYLFSIHFVIFNIYIVEWSTIIKLCINDNNCNLEVFDFISFKFYENNFYSFFLIYILLTIYYLLFLWKSFLFLYKMKKIKSLYDLKLRVKQKEMENLKFDDIIVKLINLQKSENFCRVKENLTKFDIISRILRKENYLIGLISNKVIDFQIKLPILGNKNIFSNYIYNNLNECLLKFAFLKGDVNINPKFYKLRFLQMKLLIFLIMEIIFIPLVIFFKIIFWMFKNADNIKSNRNITQNIWSSYIQIMFRNYNELQHHFENRINHSYDYIEKFINCFKERMFSIFGKFLIIICGSFFVLVFVISSIDERLLTELKFMGKKFVWITLIIGMLLSLFRSNINLNNNFRNPEEDYLENIVLKENLYKNIVNKANNVPFNYKKTQNFSQIFKEISIYYDSGALALLKEILSILLFPFIWIKIIFQAHNIIKFFKMFSKNIEGIGSIYSYSYMNINNFKCLKEKDYNSTETTFNDRKFINSLIQYNTNFNQYLIEEDNEFEILSKTYDEDLQDQYKTIYKLLFDQFKRDIQFDLKESSLPVDEKELELHFKENIFYHISKMNTNEIFSTSGNYLYTSQINFNNEII